MDIIPTCCAKDIIVLNNKKEYTLIATSLLKEVMCNPNISGDATCLWIWLYNLTRFDDNLEVSITHRECADIQLCSIKLYTTINQQLTRVTKNHRRAKISAHSAISNHD